MAHITKLAHRIHPSNTHLYIRGIINGISVHCRVAVVLCQMIAQLLYVSELLMQVSIDGSNLLIEGKIEVKYIKARAPKRHAFAPT